MSIYREHRVTWFCIDIETNGPVPGLYDLVSLGAVVVAPDADGVLSIGETFYEEVIPTAPRLDPYAERIHGITQEHLREHGVSLRVLCERLRDWVEAHTVPGTEPAFVGHNAPFDWSHVAWMYASREMPNPFGYKALCTKAMTTGALNVHWLDSNKEVIAERLGLEDEDMGRKHRADYDALYQARILIGLLEFNARRE